MTAIEELLRQIQEMLTKIVNFLLRLFEALLKAQRQVNIQQRPGNPG